MGNGQRERRVSNISRDSVSSSFSICKSHITPLKHYEEKNLHVFLLVAKKYCFGVYWEQHVLLDYSMLPWVNELASIFVFPIPQRLEFLFLGTYNYIVRV